MTDIMREAAERLAQRIRNITSLILLHGVPDTAADEIQAALQKARREAQDEIYMMAVKSGHNGFAAMIRVNLIEKES